MTPWRGQKNDPPEGQKNDPPSGPKNDPPLGVKKRPPDGPPKNDPPRGSKKRPPRGVKKTTPPGGQKNDPSRGGGQKTTPQSDPPNGTPPSVWTPPGGVKNDPPPPFGPPPSGGRFFDPLRANMGDHRRRWRSVPGKKGRRIFFLECGLKKVSLCNTNIYRCYNTFFLGPRGGVREGGGPGRRGGVQAWRGGPGGKKKMPGIIPATSTPTCQKVGFPRGPCPPPKNGLRRGGSRPGRGGVPDGPGGGGPGARRGGSSRPGRGGSADSLFSFFGGGLPTHFFAPDDPPEGGSDT